MNFTGRVLSEFTKTRYGVFSKRFPKLRVNTYLYLQWNIFDKIIENLCFYITEVTIERLNWIIFQFSNDKTPYICHRKPQFLSSEMTKLQAWLIIHELRFCSKMELPPGKTVIVFETWLFSHFQKVAKFYSPITRVPFPFIVSTRMEASLLSPNFYHLLLNFPSNML